MYFFGYAMPYFLNSFFIFGFYPIICKWLRLVQQNEQFATQFPDLARSQMLMSTNGGAANGIRGGQAKRSMGHAMETWDERA